MDKTVMDEISRCVRLNQKHDESSFLFHCGCCEYEEDIYVGSGLSFPRIYDEIVEDIGHYSFLMIHESLSRSSSLKPSRSSSRITSYRRS